MHRVAPLAGIAAAAVLFCGASPGWAADAGVIGPTYEIAEPHLLAFIERRLRDMAACMARGMVRRPDANCRKICQ